MSQSNGKVRGGLAEILPMGRRILVAPDETPEYTNKVGGVSLIIPDSCKALAPTSGAVVALGFELEAIEGYPLHVGDKIVYSKYAGVEFSFDDGHRRLVISDEDVLGIMYGEVTVEPDVANMKEQPK